MKTKTLTVVNQPAIDLELKQLDITKAYCREVYAMFDNRKIPIKLEDINQIVGWSVNGNAWQFLSALIVKRLLELPKNLPLLELSPSGQKEALKIPEWESICHWIEKNLMEGYTYQTGINVQFLQLVNGKISKLPNAKELIKEKYTKRTLVPDYDAINGKPSYLKRIINSIK